VWDKVVHEHQGWRILTCIWLHAGVVHLLANMLSLVLIGLRLEQQFGYRTHCYMNHSSQYMPERPALYLNLNWHSRFPCSENRCRLHCFWRWRQRAFISVHQEQHLCWRFWSSLWTPWSHAVGALHQLDHLLEQGAFHFFPTRY